ncbi:hypothetical protein Daesc_010517 [Daldinia eschscholtzii]|uniref:Zn(2)-C6 fungal-type domain-containing protein n=1 Tax=Daldinia eschscholtzii TaxID=292717 RepID=A0AAX6M8K3_9PEZI
MRSANDSRINGLENEETVPSSPPKPAKRRSTEDKPAGEPQKRRRRAFSCLSCQKLKCRCEYDPGAQGCRRCQTLRLQRYEGELQEIKLMLKDLASGIQPQNGRAPTSKSSSNVGDGNVLHAEQDNHIPEYFSDPADKGAQSAPIVVLRSISQKITRGCRRMLGHIDVDLLELQLLDEQTANELIHL